MTETFLEVLIGYDARLVKYRVKQPYTRTEVSVNVYGLNGESVHYSVDSSVWPSVIGDNKPGTVGKESGTWASLEDLREYVSHQRIALWVPCHIIAVCAYREADEMDDWNLTHLQIETQISPPGRDPAWPLLGFDVADRYLCGSVIDSLPRDPEDNLIWRLSLNNHQLFSDIRDAFRLGREVDEKFETNDSEVYGIYLVETLDRDFTA